MTLPGSYYESSAPYNSSSMHESSLFCTSSGGVLGRGMITSISFQAISMAQVLCFYAWKGRAHGYAYNIIISTDWYKLVGTLVEMAETSPLLESHLTASGSVVNVVPTSNTHRQHESTTIANGVTSPRVVTRSTKKHHRAPHSTHGGNPGPWTWAKWLHQGNMVGICRQSTITSFTMQLRQSSVCCLCICKELDFKLIISSLYRFKALCRIPC